MQSVMPQTLKTWVETTSLEGVSVIYNASSKFSRFCWTLVVLILLWSAIVATKDVFLIYINAPIDTSVTAINNASLTLPEIAVCSWQGIDIEKLNKVGLSSKALRYVYLLFHQYAIELTNDLSELYAPEAAAPAVSDLQTFMNRTNLTTFDQFMNYAFVSCENIFYAVKGPNDRQIRDICATNLTIVPSQTFGPCYVLPAERQYWPATIAGWHLLLKTPYVHPLVKDIQVNRGFALEFAKQYTVQSGSFHSIPLNKSVVVTLYLTHTHKLLHRYWPRHAEVHCLTTYNKRSPNQCYHWCYIKDQYEACKCGAYGMKNVYTEVIDMPTCFPGILDRSCEANMTNFHLCQAYECRPPCDEWTFDVRVTYNELQVARIMDQGNLTDYEAITDIMISYPELRYTLVEEQDIQTIETLIANVGGMVGLWLGASIFTVIHATAFLGKMVRDWISTVVNRGVKYNVSSSSVSSPVAPVKQ